MLTEIFDKIVESQEEYKLQGKINFQGLTIDIENKKGSYRTGKDKGGHEWKTYMNADYGRIRGTETKSDNEELDVYVGSNRKSDKVFRVKQMKAPNFKEFDEYKWMLGFDSKEEAEELYKKQYDKPEFFGGIDEFSFDDFKSKLKEHIKENNEKITCKKCGHKWQTKNMENQDTKYECPKCGANNSPESINEVFGYWKKII